MRAAGRAFAEKNYTIETQTDQTASVIRMACA